MPARHRRRRLLPVAQHEARFRRRGVRAGQVFPRPRRRHERIAGQHPQVAIGKGLRSLQDFILLGIIPVERIDEALRDQPARVALHAAAFGDDLRVEQVQFALALEKALGRGG